MCVFNRYCPWRYAPGDAGAAQAGWAQCLAALAPGDAAAAGMELPSKEEGGRAHQGDVVSILNKVQRVIG